MINTYHKIWTLARRKEGWWDINVPDVFAITYLEYGTRARSTRGSQWSLALSPKRVYFGCAQMAKLLI